MNKSISFKVLMAILMMAFSGCEEEKEVAVSAVSVSPTTVSLAPGGTHQLTATVAPPDAANKEVTWASDNSARATVSASGLVSIPATATAGEATITATSVADGSKKGISTVTVTIPAITATVSGTYTYTGAPVLPTVTVTAGSVTLKENVDYTLAYSDNLNAGTATVTITGTGAYVGKNDEKQFTINPLATTLIATVAEGTFTYKKAPFEPAVSVKWGEIELTEGDDYTFAYGNNTNAGTATVTVAGAGNFAGSAGEGNFTIEPFPISVVAQNASRNISASDPPLTYTVTPELFNGDALTGALTRAVGTAAGTYAITQGTLTAGGNYAITFTAGVFTIFLDLTVTIPGDYTYTGAPIVPTVTVMQDETALTLNTDYTLACSDNTNAGTATVTVTGVGAFAGSTVTANFTIARLPISVTANDKEKNFWASDPALTYTATPPLFAGDQLTGWLTRTGSNAVGIYEVTRGTLANEGNYEITDFTSGVFTIYYYRGEGTSAAPFEIETLQQLKGLGDFVNASNGNFNDKFYKLTADINLDVSPYNSGTGWTPIGTSANPFRGHFNGNYRRITGLFINNSSGYVGLFGSIVGGSVQNLGVEGSTVSGTQYVGGLAGYVSGIVTNCYTNVSVRGNIGNTTQLYAGGVAGYTNTGSLVANCYSTGTVTGYRNIGGVVGYINGSTVTNCYATGTVSGERYVGGVVGYVINSGGFAGIVEYCAALNPSINRSSGANSEYGRVVYRPSSGAATVANNVAWVVMELPSGTLTGNHGSDITTENAQEQSSYEAMIWRFGFNDDNPWKMGVGDYKLPVFYWQTTAPTAMPTHLQ